MTGIFRSGNTWGLGGTVQGQVQVQVRRRRHRSLGMAASPCVPCSWIGARGSWLPVSRRSVLLVQVTAGLELQGGYRGLRRGARKGKWARGLCRDVAESAFQQGPGHWVRTLIRERRAKPEGHLRHLSHSLCGDRQFHPGHHVFRGRSACQKSVCPTCVAA